MFNHSRRAAASLLAAIVLFTPYAASAQVEITYLGNEGVLLRSPTASVLVDALHGPYKMYATASAATRAKLEQGQPPYDAIDLVLVSHVHADHFDPAMVARRLEARSGVKLVSSPQVIDAVRDQLRSNSQATSRMETVAVEPGLSRTVRVKPGLTVTLLGLPHGGRSWNEIQNLGHIIEIGGVKVLHVGDADTDPAMFAKFRLVDERIDIALLPDWYLAYDGGQRLVRQHIRPARMCAVHVIPDNVDEITRRVRAAFPDVEILTEIGTKITISPPN
jgi:L-ascorbate metabolism protein UlaG (beta-lactamase superfamily)